MNNMIAWWAKNTVAANLLMLGIIISGIFAYGSVGREITPVLAINVVQVNVAWPGAAPEEVEEQIVIRIEESLSDMDNIDRLRGFSSEGFGRVFVEAMPQADVAKFINDVKMRIDSISNFPRGIEPPQVSQLVFRQEIFRIAVHGDVSERKLKAAAEWARDEIATLPGASVVTLFGTRNEEVTVELSEDAMRRYGITFDQVATAIRASSLNSSSGTVRSATGDNMITARNVADTKQDFENIIVKQTADGGIIRVGDVATVIDGFEENEILATMNGQPAILVQVMGSDNMDVVRSSKAVAEWLEKNGDRFPEGTQATLWNDSSKIYTDRMNMISKSAVTGLALVFIILILTLRPKVALWVTLGIATAFAGAFIFLPALGISLNMISLFAFLLVIGVVVDDAIVVGESIHTEGQTSGGGESAAILGAQLVAKPVFFAVLTTMVAFAPWMFISGPAQAMTMQISVIVIASLAFSLIEAFFILPAHLSKMKPRPKESMGKFSRFQKGIADSITTFADKTYRQWAKGFVEHRYITAAAFITFFMLSVGLLSSGWLKFSFMPDIENEEITVTANLMEGTPYSRALEVLQQFQDAQQQLVDEVNAASETGEAKLIENWYTRSRRDSVLAIVKMVPPEERAISIKDAALRLRELIGDIPDAQSVTVQYRMDDGNNDDGIQFVLKAKDMDELKAASIALQEKLRTYDALYDISDNLVGAVEEIRLKLRPGAESLGINLQLVSRQVRQAYYGEEVQRLARPDGDVKVMVKYPRIDRESLESLADFRVRLGDGREVPLMSVVDLEFAPGIKSIQRWERRRAVVVRASMNTEDSKNITDDLDDNFFPAWEKEFPGVNHKASGQAEGERKFLQEIFSLSAIALFVMYAFIAVAFGSYFMPLLVLTAIPFGFMGAVYGHMLWGMPMGLFSFFGIAAAAGVVVNDNLVMLDYMNRLKAKGLSAYDAVVEAGVARFRPILLTSVTTFVGLMPMMMEQSTQAEFLKPMILSLAFGVAFALSVTLALVPALYGIGEDFHKMGHNTKMRIKRLFGFGPKTLEVKKPQAGE
jgi:multidrug efflux pump subunit AcrB